MLNLWGEEEAPPAMPEPKPVLTYQEQLAANRERAKERARERAAAGNPLIGKYGAGPEGKTCGACSHLLAIHHHDKMYYKCEMVRLTHGPGSDFRKKWLACGKFVEGKAKEYDLDF